MSKLEYIPSEREQPMIVIDNYLFNKYRTNANGSISWRCKQYLTSITCKSTCTTLGEDIIRPPQTHNGHSPYSTSFLKSTVLHTNIKKRMIIKNGFFSTI